jgi:hypothetical protein
MDEIKKLYDVLSSKGYYSKSFDDFKVQFQDKGYQDKVFGVVSRDGLYTKSKDEFLAKYVALPQQDTSKKKEVSQPVLPTGGEVGISEVPSEEGGAISKAISKGIETALQQPKVKQAIEGKQREDVLSFLQQEKAKAPTKITGPTPTMPTEGVILPAKSLKKVETSFALPKEKIDNIVVPTFQEVASSADPLGAIEQKESEEKDLQRKADLMAVSTLVKDQIPDFYKAFKAAQSPLPDTRTNQLVKERAANYESATRGLREIKAPDLMTANNLFIESNIIPQIERAAVMYHINRYPSFKDELAAVNTGVDNPNLSNAIGSAKMGQIMQEFLYSPEVIDFENQEDSNIGAAIQRAREVNLSRNTMWGVSVVGNKVSQAFERSPLRRNAIAGFDTPALRKDLNTVATQVLTPEEYKIYDLYIKGNEDQYLDTPSLLERFARGGEGVLVGAYNTLSKIAGYGKSTKDVVRENWEKEAMNITADPEGLRGFLADSGNVLGLVAAIGATGRVATPLIGAAAAGTGLPATTTAAVADAVNLSTAFFGDMLDQGTVKFPNDPMKAYTSAIFNTAAFVAMGRSIFPLKKVQSVFSKAQPEVNQVVSNLANGSITREVAKKELNTIVKKGVDVLGAGLSQNLKVSAELTALQGANEILDIALGMDPDKLKKLYPEGTYGESFKHLFLSNAIISSVAGYGKVKQKNNAAKESIYEAASNPKRYANIIEQSAVKDPTLNKQELLDNLAFSVEVKRLLDQKGIPVEKQKDYLILALGERAALAEKAKIQDSTLKKEIENKISEAQQEKEAILSAPEEEVAPEMAQYTMEAPRVAGEPEQISKPIELSVEPKVPAAEELTYRVDYFDPETNKMASKMFATEKEGSAFQRGLTSEQNKYGSKGYYTSAKGVGEVAPEAAPEVPKSPEIEKKSDADIEKRMQEIEESAGGIPSFQTESGKEYDFLEKEMEKREKASVFNVTLDKVKEAVDALIKKEKEMPNGYGAFIEMKDARETKSVANKYLNASELTESEIYKDFADAVMGNPDTWYADGLKLRESLKEATNRGIDAQKMVERIVQEFVRDGFTEEEAKSVVARQLAPIFEGSKKAAPELPKAPVEEMEDMPELGEVRPETPRTEPPAFEGYKPIEFAEAFEVEEKPKAKEVKAETDIRKRALNLDVEGVPRGEVLQYFIGGGKISSDAIKKLFQRSENRIRWNVMKPEERKSRIGLSSKKGPTIEELAEKLAGADRLDMTQEFRNIIEEVVLENYGTKSMEKELVESYDAEYRMMMREQELIELGEEMERQIQEFTAGLPEAQKREIAEVLNEVRNNDGTIDWDTIEREMQSAELSSSPIIQKLSPETQKLIIDGIKQLNETGRVSRVPVEAVPSAEAGRKEGAKERKPKAELPPTDKRAEARKRLKDAFDDFMSSGIVYDPRSQAEKQVRLTKAIINAIKEEAIGAIKDLKKYIKENVGIDISDNDAKYLLLESKKPEYAIQEPAAGEVPVQPEAGVSGKMEAGVPPTEPPKVTEKGESPRKERQKALLNRIVDSKGTPEALKEQIREKGLTYKPASQKEATRLANAIIDSIGIDQAVEMASRSEFSDVFGGMNSAVLSEAASRLVNDPVKQAQVFATLDNGLLWKGQDVSYMNEFYTKNPLGVVIYENTRRKNDFEQWSTKKEKQWQDAYDVLKAEKEALKKELEELRIEKPTNEGVQRAKVKAEKARQKRADIIEKYKNKGGGLTLTTGGLTKEGIEFVGEVSLTYIQEGVANAEVVIRKVLADLKTAIGKDVSQEVRNEVEQIVRRVVNDKKGAPVIDRIRKKLEGLSNKEKEEVIRQSYKKIIESGALEFEDFKNIIADVLGRGPLSEADAKKLQDLTVTINELEAKALDAQELRTPEALKAHKIAQKEAAEASKELSNLFNNKPNILKRISQLIQLRTLGIVALINNPFYNIVNQAFLRFPIGLTNTLIDRAVSAGAKAANVQINPSTNVLSRRVQAEYFKKLKLGFKESGEQLFTGLNRQDYIQKETYAQSIQPLESMKALYRYAKGKQKMSLAEVVDRSLQATGADAEAVARTLNIGDKPFRFGSEGATAADFSEALGLSKGIDYELFIEFPKAEAYRIYKKQGLSDAEATQKAEYIEKSIIQEGKRAAFQQDNFLADLLKMISGEVSKKTGPGVGELTSTLVVSPYIKTPANVFWSYYNLLHPEVALLQAFAYGGKAYKLREKDPTASKLALREGRFWFGHAVTGIAYVSVISSMVGAGIFTAGSTAEDTKKEREGRSYYGKPGTTNVTKLMAWLRGEDPTQIKGGYTIKNSWFGHIGTLGNAIARREQEMTPEQLKNRGDLMDRLISNVDPDNLFPEALEGLQSGIFSNTSSLLNSIQSDFGAKRWGLNTINLLTNVVQPATLAQISRAELPYYSSTKADSFMGELRNSMLQRSSMFRALTGEVPPAKVGIWGDRLEKKDNFMMRFFGISKENPDNFAQPLYDIVKRTNNISYFPPTIKPEIEDEGKTSKLNTKQTIELEMMVGQYRKNLVAPLLNDFVDIGKYGVWSELEDYFKGEGLSNEEARKKADELKLDALRNAYDYGFELGKEAFLDAHPEFRNLDYDNSEMKDKKNAMEKVRKQLKQF